MKCACARHVECVCLKCMLARRVAELIAPSRGLRAMAIDRLDPPATLSVDSHCAIGEATGDRDTASLIHTLVADAVGAAAACPRHASFHDTDVECASVTAGAHSCMRAMKRADSWTVYMKGSSKTQLSAASTLCGYCARGVYGISKTQKLARLACTDCCDPMDALLYGGLGGPLLADRRAVSAAVSTVSPPAAPTASPPAAPTAAPVAASNDVCVCGVYDSLLRGRDTRTGAMLCFEPARVEMHSGEDVLTPSSAAALGLCAATLDAARSAKRRCATPWISPPVVVPPRISQRFR